MTRERGRGTVPVLKGVEIEPQDCGPARLPSALTRALEQMPYL